VSAVSRIWGVVEDSGPEGITIRVDGTGLGLLVQVPGHTRDALGVPGRDISLYTHLQARENDVALYGFATADELRLFHLLIGVSGVGPKGAAHRPTRRLDLGRHRRRRRRAHPRRAGNRRQDR
jgi:Holliday junction DNA helicase RuvA